MHTDGRLTIGDILAKVGNSLSTLHYSSLYPSIVSLVYDLEVLTISAAFVCVFLFFDSPVCADRIPATRTTYNPLVNFELSLAFGTVIAYYCKSAPSAACIVICTCRKFFGVYGEL